FSTIPQLHIVNQNFPQYYEITKGLLDFDFYILAHLNTSLSLCNEKIVFIFLKNQSDHKNRVSYDYLHIL
ncbi:hypothetical protein V2M97_11140, partial [Streptococcus pneumoniae]